LNLERQVTAFILNTNHLRTDNSGNLLAYLITGPEIEPFHLVHPLRTTTCARGKGPEEHQA